MSVEAAKSALNDKLNGKPFINAKVKFNLGDGDVILVDGTASPATVSSDDVEADVTLTLSPDDFLELLDGSLDSQMAFMTGKLKIDGNMGLAMQLNQFLG